ncbi:hypothetical protein DNTS_024781 [Danionella cerebrum]|uniref:RING-type domain-containing protein n=1 Tax=Danionella cerebrum TaxID=2873325 RepID=A0A553MZM5_9TELE|nr:hypothetical protein DNTS_024781 [Danionella translucida]
MVLFEDQECGVCYLRYTRIERVPRMLHCNHTFCTPCLETMGLHYSGLRTIRCPLCRQVTCVGHGFSLQGALYVNALLWDNISDEAEEEEEQTEQGKDEAQNISSIKKAPSQTDCPVPKLKRPKLRLPSFLKKKRCFRTPADRIMPISNV